MREQVETDLRGQMTQGVNDPFLVGWSWGNEFDEHIKPDEVRAILKRGAEVPAKRALVDHALNGSYGSDPAKLAAAWQVSPASTEAIAIVYFILVLVAVIASAEL